MKKFLLLSLLPVHALAQNVSLDNLLLLSTKNYCYLVSQGQYQNISQAFNLDEKTVITLAGLRVQAVSINYPMVSVVTSGEELGRDLIKSSTLYTAKDFQANPLKNTYSINNTMDLRFNESPGELMARISRSYPGITLKPEMLGGGYLFKQEKPVNVSQAKNFADFTKEYDRYVGAAFNFSISPLKGEWKGGSALSYQCLVNKPLALSAQELANQMKGKTAP